MISFKTRAEGGSRAGDRTEIRRALSILVAPGGRHELRALPGGAGRVALGDDLDAATQAAMDLSDRQVYYSLNPIRPDEGRAKASTVVRRRWFLIDIDTTRPVDASSTDDEKGLCYEVAARIAFHLADRGWPWPLIVDSGNGFHLLYRVDLPNDKLSQELLKAALVALNREFKGPAAEVDAACHDAPRISKLPGTWAMKGPDTPERPHRMARIAYEPASYEVVTPAQIQELGMPPAPPEAASGKPGPFATRANDATAGKEAYVRRAIELECQRVLIAPRGERNNALNRAAFVLGQFDSWPEMDSAVVREALRVSACHVGLDSDPGCGMAGILASIDSGWTAGSGQPRPRPADPANGKPQAAANGNPPARLTQCLRDIESLDVDWLWEGLVARGFVAIFGGRTGVGKSFVTCDFVARASRGEHPAFAPPSAKPRPLRTLFISEDPPQYMIKPRLVAMKADQGMIHCMTFKAMAEFRLDRLDMLEAAYHECGCPELIVIDPPTNFLGRTDDHKNSELRTVLMGIVEWIDHHKVACIMITHFNKAVGKGMDAVMRIIGGTAWTSVGRTVVIFEQDPDNPSRFLVAGGKNNVGRKAGTHAYKIEPTDSHPIVKWLGPVDTTADDAVNKVKKKSRAQNAAEWLTERFRERRSWPSDDLYDLGKAEGVSRSAIWEAQETLPLRREQETPQDGGRRYWQWTAIPPWPPDKPAKEDQEKESKRCETLKRRPDNPLEDKDLHSVSTSDSDRNGETESTVSEFQSFTVSEGDGTETVGETVEGSPPPSGEEPPFPMPEGWRWFGGKGKTGGSG